MERLTMVEELKNIGASLYQLKTEESLQKLVEIIEESNFLNNNYTEYLNLINHFLANRDYILLADLITYELIPEICNKDIV
jgi:hypothetical protein